MSGMERDVESHPGLRGVKRETEEIREDLATIRDRLVEVREEMKALRDERRSLLEKERTQLGRRTQLVGILHDHLVPVDQIADWTGIKRTNVYGYLPDGAPRRG